MFSMPKKALYKPISRRKFLELGGGVATALGAGSIAVGMNSSDHPSAGLCLFVR